MAVLRRTDEGKTVIENVSLAEVNKLIKEHEEKVKEQEAAQQSSTTSS